MDQGAINVIDHIFYLWIFPWLSEDATFPDPVAAELLFREKRVLDTCTI